MMKTAMLDSWTRTMPITAPPAGEHGPSPSLRVTRRSSPGSFVTVSRCCLLAQLGPDLSEIVHDNDRYTTAPADAVLSPTSLRSGLKSKEGTSDPAWSTRVGIS